MRMLCLGLGLGLSLSLPAAALTGPMQCEILRECVGDQCNDTSGTVLELEPTENGIRSWDQAVPQEQIELQRVPGNGPLAWTGRAPNIGAVVLLTLVGSQRIVITMHTFSPSEPLFSAHATCQGPDGAAPLTKRG